MNGRHGVRYQGHKDELGASSSINVCNLWWELHPGQKRAIFRFLKLMSKGKQMVRGEDISGPHGLP